MHKVGRRRRRPTDDLQADRVHTYMHTYRRFNEKDAGQEGPMTLALRHSGTQCTRTYTARTWANAQRDGRPAEYMWRPLFNATKFG